MDEMNNVNTQQPNTQPADNGTQGTERMFTQAEVDKIVKERLARAKNTPKEPTEAETRERELTARESRLSCREHLIEKGYPAQLLDVIDTSDIEGFKTKAEIVSGLLRSNKKPVSGDHALEAVKLKVAAESGIPSDLALRLNGESEKEIRKDAEVLRGVVRAIKGAAPLASHDSNSYETTPASLPNAKHKPRQFRPYAE